jgi:hypothetical protein
LAIDEILTRTQIWRKTFTILRNHDILDFQIVDEFQDRYKAYNQKNFGVDSLKYHQDRERLVLQREQNIAIEILKERQIPNAELYFQCN